MKCSGIKGLVEVVKNKFKTFLTLFFGTTKDFFKTLYFVKTFKNVWKKIWKKCSPSDVTVVKWMVLTKKVNAIFRTFNDTLAENLIF